MSGSLAAVGQNNHNEETQTVFSEDLSSCASASFRKQCLDLTPSMSLSPDLIPHQIHLHQIHLHQIHEPTQGITSNSSASSNSPTNSLNSRMKSPHPRKTVSHTESPADLPLAFGDFEFPAPESDADFVPCRNCQDFKELLSWIPKPRAILAQDHAPGLPESIHKLLSLIHI